MSLGQSLFQCFVIPDVKKKKKIIYSQREFPVSQFCPFPLSCSLAPLKRVRSHPLDIDPEEIFIHLLSVAMDPATMTLGLRETFL